MDHELGTPTLSQCSVTPSSSGRHCDALIELKEPSGVRIRQNSVKVHLNNYWICEVEVEEFNNFPEVTLQVKTWLKASTEADKFFFTEKRITLTPDNKEVVFKSAPSYAGHKSPTFCIEIRPIYEKTSMRESQENILSNWTGEFVNAKYSDAVVKVGDEKSFKVNKLVLCIQSEVFAKMFEHNLKEKETNIVEIKNADAETVEALLRFLYSGQVENIEKLAVRLLVLADQYQIPALTKLCMKSLSQKITIENVIERLLLLSLPDQLTSFKTSLFAFMKQNNKEIRQLPEWSSFARDHGELLDEFIAFSYN